MSDWTEIRAAGVLYEDDAALVLDKPAGISVVGERHELDLVRLAADAGEPLHWVHRIDKVTSGAVLFAKEQRRHGPLTRQFADRTVGKRYLAVVRHDPGAGPLPERGAIELPLSVGRKNRVRVAAPREAITWSDGRFRVPEPEVFTGQPVYPSTSEWEIVWSDERHALLALHPATGRRHQLRVHLAWTGHPIVGDPLFEKSPAIRTGLHSWRLAFDADWLAGERISVEAPAPADLLALAGPTTAPAEALAAYEG